MGPEQAGRAPVATPRTPERGFALLGIVIAIQS
jgi:hypothetical protein